MDLKEFKPDLKPSRSRHELVSNRRIINKLLFGNTLSNVKNKGIEFEDYRRYTLADDAIRIDWKASLRSNELVIKEATEDKAIDVMFVLDVSDTMLFSSGDKLKCEYAAELVSGLSFAVQRGGNPTGLCLFNNRIKKLHLPKSGTKQYLEMVSTLRDVKNYGGIGSLKIVLMDLMAIVKSPTMIIIISDFIDKGDDDWPKYLAVTSLNHHIIGICVRDPLDRRIPENAGYFVIEDPSSEKKIMIDTKQAHNKYNQKIVEEEVNINKMFKRVSSLFIMVETNQNYEDQILKALEKSNIAK